jgi:uncharacterized protein (DUF1800 family)
MTREHAVHSLTRPHGAETMSGPDPHLADGSALAPYDRSGHDHLWWLDRMVRSSQPLIERMTLILHDWFATSNDKVDNQRQMLEQNELLRAHALGSFADLFRAITINPATLVWLDGASNHADDINENYAREMMELFSLGADRGAYSERDVREQARALSGWTNASSDQQGNYNFRYDEALHDAGDKTVFGQTGRFGWEDAVRLCLTHPLHPSFFVTKLWSYFVPVPPSAARQRALEAAYRSSGYSLRPVVEQILLSDEFFTGPMMVKPPVVFTAGVLRALGRGIDSDHWVGFAEQTGQRLFHPPNVSGWTKDRWLDTSTFKGRWDTVADALDALHLDPSKVRYPKAETPTAAVARALRFLGNPPLTPPTKAYLLAFARSCVGSVTDASQQSPARAMRQNALRQLVLTAPDLQVA